MTVGSGRLPQELWELRAAVPLYAYVMHEAGGWFWTRSSARSASYISFLLSRLSWREPLQGHSDRLKDGCECLRRFLSSAVVDVKDSTDNLCVDTGACGSLFLGPVPMSLGSWACGFKAILAKPGSGGSHGAGLDRLACALRSPR